MSDGSITVKNNPITSFSCDSWYNVELFLKLRGRMPTDNEDINLVELAKEYKSKMDASEFDDFRSRGQIDIFAIYHHCNNIIEQDAK